MSEVSVLSPTAPAVLPLRAMGKPSLQWLAESETAQWDAFVAGHPYGLIYHSSAWRSVLHAAFPHIRGNFLVLRNPEDGAIQAGMPVYAVKSWLLGNRVSSLPFASFCDPLIASSEQFQLMVPELEALRASSKSRLAE